MPFSWKNKTRRNRFSQLVADHLQSPKRGGSLVVETGFPTSLIDLYVRNRGMFRKSSANKPNQSSSCLSSPSSGSFVELNNSSSSDSLLDLNNSSSGDSDFRETDDEIVEEDVVVDSEIKIENYSKPEAKLSPVLVVMLKVLLMAVLIFGSKRFTIAITLSAFLLFFLESVGKRLKSPNLDSNPLFESSLHETNNIRRSKQTATVVVCSEVLEIEEQVESKQEESDEVRSEFIHKSSRKAMMKSRIKKFVPKKLRRSSMDSNHETCYEFRIEETVNSARNVKPLVCLNECSGETFCILKQDHDKIVESRTNLQQNCRCLVLFLIVLVGLIGGRFLALVMALSWCLMLKLKLQLRNVKFFIY